MVTWWSRVGGQGQSDSASVDLSAMKPMAPTPTKVMTSGRCARPPPASSHHHHPGCHISMPHLDPGVPEANCFAFG
eukprot:scaffold13307_cov97-Isochrysis_galbana.AAC.11